MTLKESGPEVGAENGAALQNALEHLLGFGPDNHGLIQGTVVGQKVFIKGTVESYAAKRRVEEALRRLGCTDVEDWLRVMPG